MDKLKLAFSLIAVEAKKQRDIGKVPIILGVRGMLALMHQAIINFCEVEDRDEHRYVIELAVKAMFAVASILPDEEDLDELSDDEPTTREEDTEEESKEETVDPRWTAVPPGEPLPSVSKDREPTL